MLQNFFLFAPNGNGFVSIYQIDIDINVAK